MNLRVDAVTGGKNANADIAKAIRRLSPDIAWPTIALLVALYAAGGLSLWAGISGRAPLWLMCVINTLVAYGSYTPLHEAIHGNVARGRFRQLTQFVGVAAGWLFMHNYTLQRATHLSHHANLNDPALDADHWVAGKTPLSVLLRCMTVVFAHYVVGWRISDSRTRLRGVAENLVPLAFIAFAAGFWGWEIALYGLALPALLGATLLGLLFDFAVHTPYDKGATDRYLNTRVYLFPGIVNVLGTVLWCAQNYHLVHHLYPGVPFYAYPAAFRLARPLLSEKGSPIIALGR